MAELVMKPHAYQFGLIDTNDRVRGTDLTHSGVNILTDFDFLLCASSKRDNIMLLWAQDMYLMCCIDLEYTTSNNIRMLYHFLNIFVHSLSDNYLADLKAMLHVGFCKACKIGAD
jgi:hypothetical protein